MSILHLYFLSVNLSSSVFFSSKNLLLQNFFSTTMAAIAVVFAVLAALLPGSLSAQNHTTFIFNRFNASTDLAFLGNTLIRSNYDALCLTNQSHKMYGRALYTHPVRFKDPASPNTTFSFSTTFVFTILPNPVDLLSGYGLAFIIAPNKSPVANSTGHFLGLFNSSDNAKLQNHLFAVEFDTVQNPEYRDPDDNHVGIDLNELTSIQAKSAAYWNGYEFLKLDLNSGHNIQAWIDYDHNQNQINVTIGQAGSVRPLKPLISVRNKSLPFILQEEMYVGFSASTGNFVEDHCILAWSFTTNGTAPPLDVSHLPSLLRTRSNASKRRLVSGVTAACVCLVVCVIFVSLWWWKRRKYRDVVEEWEVEYWPHRFKYKDLYVATKGFSEDQVLGCGGFGRVYKGVLPSSGLQVAVKRMLRESTQGLKDFIAEISSLGRLQHRNLVQIRGYCKRGVQLFIVYDFMPNGSLEKLIFENPNGALKWGERYKILRDVAAGLLYLHQGWEKRVVHRDIKSSNVLVDDKLNGKLGDFGLARLYEHDERPLTTRLVGTLGYIAPELVDTGKATPSSDVYSFGIVMMEVACGRRAVELNADGAQIALVDWVRELYVNGRLMDAADPLLGGAYEEHEMDRVLRVGMVCCSEEAEARGDMRQVVQILEGEASVGDLVPFAGRTKEQRPLNVERPIMTSGADCASSWSLEAR